MIRDDELKFEGFRRAVERKDPPHRILYDAESDLLVVELVLPETESVVHYHDRFAKVGVAFLIEPTTRQVIGIQFEAFLKRFIPAHARSESWAKIAAAARGMAEYGDLVVVYKSPQSKLKDPLIQASKEIEEEMFGGADQNELVPA